MAPRPRSNAIASRSFPPQGGGIKGGNQKMNKHLLIFILFATCFAWAQDALDLPYDVAPWPIGDSLKMPAFPELGLLAGIDGFVDVILRIDENGKLQIEQKAEYPEGLGFYDSVAVRLKEWQFQPARFRDKPVESRISMHFQFMQMREDSASLLRMPIPGLQARPKAWVVPGRQKTDLQVFQPPVILYKKQLIKVGY